MASYFTTGNSLSIPKANASSISPAQMSGKVYLNVYDLHPYNAYLSPIGTGFYHSGILKTCIDDKNINSSVTFLFFSQEWKSGTVSTASQWVVSLKSCHRLMITVAAQSLRRRCLTLHRVTNIYDHSCPHAITSLQCFRYLSETSRETCSNPFSD